METQKHIEGGQTEIKTTAFKKGDAVKSRGRTKTSVVTSSEADILDREQAGKRVRAFYREVFRKTGIPEGVAGKLIDEIDAMTHGSRGWSDHTEEEELSGSEKLRRFAELATKAAELGSTKVTYDLGFDIEVPDGNGDAEPNFDRSIIDQLNPESFKIDLIREALGEYKSILDMTPTQIEDLEASQRESEIYPRVRLRDSLPADGFRLEVPTVFEGIKFKLEARAPRMSRGLHLPTQTKAELSN